MSYIALQLYSTTRFGTEICLEKGRADVALVNRDEGTAAVIELKYTQDSSQCKKMAEEGLEQIEKKEYAKQLQKYYDVVLLGVGISKDKEIAVLEKKSILSHKEPEEGGQFPSLLEYNLA